MGAGKIIEGLVEALAKEAPKAKKAAKPFFPVGSDERAANLDAFYGETHPNYRLRYYTGTSKDKDFTAFNESRHGTWLTSDPTEASGYALQNDSMNLRPIPGSWSYEKVNSASRVIPAHARITNPYTGEMPDFARADNYKKAQSDWFDTLRAQGYDAWAPESRKGDMVVILKDQGTNVKSATGNNGAFDRTKKHMGYAAGGIVRDILEGVAREAPELARGARPAARRAMINIGLDINGGEKLMPEEVLATLQRMGVKPVRAAVHQSDSEPTLVIELDRSLKPDEAHYLSENLRQEAIAQVDETGAGDLYGPAADKWKPFNGDYFLDADGKRLSQAIMDAGSGEKPGFDKGGLVGEAAEWLAKYVKRDNPATRGHPGGAEWLARNQERANAASNGRALRGPDTAWAHEVDLPVELLAKMPGASGEVRVPGDPKYDDLLRRVQEEGWQPEGNGISVAINHRGEPFIYEGNTRAAVARALGIDTIPGDIHWMNGAEMGEHEWTPEKIAEFLHSRKKKGYDKGGLVKKAIEGLEAAISSGSKTVDELKPKRLYHGTENRQTIDELDPFITLDQLGTHLGDADTAAKFARVGDHVQNWRNRKGDALEAGARVIPLDVDMKNPLRLQDNKGTWAPHDVYKQIADQGLVPYDENTFKSLKYRSEGWVQDPDGSWGDYGDEMSQLDAMTEVQDMIRDLGHDGVVYLNRYEIPNPEAQARAHGRPRTVLNSLTDDQFRAEFPEASDSYIAFRRGQMKSPFGDGPGVGYADGGQVEVDAEGRQKFNKGNLVRKLGAGVVDLLDFKGLHAGNQIRDNIVNGTELRGDGRKFTGFFGDVTSGKSDKYKPHGLDNYDPAIELGEYEQQFRRMRDGYSGNFDNHIKTSIPGFDEVQNAVGSSLLKTYGRDGADILDIASSEGALIKALSAGSDGRIRTTGIEPNADMTRTYLSKPQAPGSQSVMAAFGSADDAGKLAWEEADGTPIRFFDPKGQQYDAAHEAMAFQFISNARRAQAERVKQMLKPKGIAIFEEKFGNPKSIFDANEAQKDAYKSQFYTPEQMEIKRKEVLNGGNDAVEGMTDLQVSQAEMEEILRNTFKNRAQFWDSGNFKGYVASDDARALEDYLNNLQSLDSIYSTTKTPRGFADGGMVQNFDKGGLARKLGEGLIDYLGYGGVKNRPRTVKIPGMGEHASMPITEIDDAAEAYMKKYGIPGTHRIDEYPEFDEEFAKKIANQYDVMPHAPNDPAVKRTYEALIDETMDQYRALKDTGLDIEFLKDGMADPYGASPSMGYADMVNNGHLWVFPTSQGYGSAGEVFNHPLLKKVGKVGDLEDAVANDAFRVVHDAYGHFGPGNPFFRGPGEDRAWMHHARMYSDDALPSMTAETRAQNSWVNYGPKAMENKGKNGADTIYADQKALVLPSWVFEKDLGRKPRFAEGGTVPTPEEIASMTHDHSYGTGRDMNYLETLGGKIPLGEANYYDVDGERRMPEGIQGLHDVGRLGIYGVPVVGPYIGAGLDTAEAIATDDPLSAGMAVAFGPGGKIAKGAMTGVMALGMDPAEAEAGVFGRLAKWAQGSEGKDALNAAIKMSSQGASDVEINAATGWFKDLDGHWKFWRPSTGGGLELKNTRGKLGNALIDPHLFDQYPDMQDIKFRRSNQKGAHWDAQNNEIVLGDTSSPWFQEPYQGGAYGSVLHEAYHGKSSKEGWANGMALANANAAVMKDINKFYGLENADPSIRGLADAMMYLSPDADSGLPYKRYKAEMGEALARREAGMRELAPENLGPFTPAHQMFLDMPKNSLFHPGQNSTPEQYRELIRMLTDEQVARDMMNAGGR